MIRSQDIQTAYEVLRDPLRREIYDRYGKVGLDLVDRGRRPGDVSDDFHWPTQPHRGSADVHSLFEKLRERSPSRKKEREKERERERAGSE